MKSRYNSHEDCYMGEDTKTHLDKTTQAFARICVPYKSEDAFLIVQTYIYRANDF